jgi:hypothetical protein
LRKKSVTNALKGLGSRSMKSGWVLAGSSLARRAGVGDGVVEAAELIDEPELARGAAGPDAALADLVHAHRRRGRGTARPGR